MDTKILDTTNTAFVLNQILDQSNKTATNISDKTGVSRGSISHYRYGYRDPTLGKFIRIVNACGYKVLVMKDDSDYE